MKFNRDVNEIPDDLRKLLKDIDHIAKREKIVVWVHADSGNILLVSISPGSEHPESIQTKL